MTLFSLRAQIEPLIQTPHLGSFLSLRICLLEQVLGRVQQAPLQGHDLMQRVCLPTFSKKSVAFERPSQAEALTTEYSSCDLRWSAMHLGGVILELSAVEALASLWPMYLASCLGHMLEIA